MKHKYYLSIEIRYSYWEKAGDEEEQKHPSKFMHSDLFDNEDACIKYGNSIIEANKWMEQYPGHVGKRLERRFGYPLVAPSLKNGAQIFISVLSLRICGADEMSAELQKFNIPAIKHKIQ